MLKDFEGNDRIESACRKREGFSIVKIVNTASRVVMSTDLYVNSDISINICE